ncbi:MAG: anion permease, partial [Rhodospirillales bacterium]|nr:anion permease [Rhodospirillales bacterium]
AIMIGYWREFFFDPNVPETAKYLVGYLRWMIFAYPIFLIQIPFVMIVLFMTFRPEYSDLSRAVVRLRAQVEQEGPMKRSAWVSLILFFMTLLGWIFLSDKVGMGTIALLSATAFLIAGLVRWEDINSGVNWGVVLLYGAAISLGVEMKDSGAAAWVAASFLDLLAPFGAEKGLGLLASVSVLTAGIANTMSAGASVAILGPIMLKVAIAANESPIMMGFVTAVSTGFGYLTVFAAPACTIVYASGYLKATDFLRAGWKLVIISTIMVLCAAAFYWPLLGV